MEDWQRAAVALANRERVNTKALTYIENRSLQMLEGDAGIKQGTWIWEPLPLGATHMPSRYNIR
jgi:hypothetical protein